MNAGITTSFIVGGLLLLAILQFSSNVFQNSAEITLDMNDKHNIVTLRQIIEHDFSRIGFGNGPNDVIKNFNPPHLIIFNADLTGNNSAAEVKWHFKSNKPVNSTSNPNDHVLLRHAPMDSSNGRVKNKYHVVDFSITGYSDANGENTTTDKNDIKSILVEVIYESPEAVTQKTNGTQYSRSTWRKLFVPSNLQFKTF
ncbi:hypothetical protein [Fodinibius saliphilus]|uniref:hypothetical protein n=1 Tax=Fodinibius saliphilus TaxID=1920650 RepID=UPI001108AC19|nr:hypothetical protein [Fodinibius saliphilus]